MMNWGLFRTVLGIIGNVTSFALFLSPAPYVYQIFKEKSVGNFNPFPYVAGIMNCVMWVFYSMNFVHPHSLLVTTINSIGLAMFVGYIVNYLCFTDNKSRMKVGLMILGEAVVFAALACVTLLVFHTHTARSNFVGVFCDIFGIILYGSPLSSMHTVIKNKSVVDSGLQSWISFAGLANGILWTGYALIRFDPYILIGNGLGGLLSLSQVILYFIYRNGPAPPKATKVQQLAEIV